MQPVNPVNGRAAFGEPDEDCLYLNVWKPATGDGRRPVMVWLHGGAFTFGAGSRPSYHGSALARRGDVVVVTINYRLGVFGWLRGIDVCGQVLPTSGNEGLLDQLAALQWVKDQIASFGGDPDNVTVFGQSAGATSIHAMLATQPQHRLFHKAILQSGTNLFHPPEAANRVLDAVLRDLDVASHALGRLRDLAAAELLEVQTRVTPRAAGIAYRPVADGDVIPTDPFAAVAGGSAREVPLLIGTNLEEQKFFSRLDPEVEQLTDERLLEKLIEPGTAAQAAMARSSTLPRR